jgi:AcrR family transcriptional regulator
MRPLPQASDERRDTRTVILDAADAVVAERGVASLTFDEVARQAGVSRGGVLYHFASKEALTEAMVQRFIDRFDVAVAKAAAQDRQPIGRNTRAYLLATLGEPPLTGELFDKANGAITAALANFPERLEPVREQSARSQRFVESDTIDPVLATIIRLAIDGLWLAENLNLMRFDPALKARVGERLIAWSRLRDLPDAARNGAPQARGGSGCDGADENG